MGPEAAKSWPGPRGLLAAPREQPPPPAGPARPEIDGRRPAAGPGGGPARRGGGAGGELGGGGGGGASFCGFFHPATGAAYTAPYPRRTAVNWADFLAHVEGWLDPAVERVDAVLDNLSAHRATDVLLFALAHPRWEFVFQPTYAAYLNLIEPWWKILRSLALKGRRFESWQAVCQ